MTVVIPIQDIQVVITYHTRFSFHVLYSQWIVSTLLVLLVITEL